MVGYILRDAIRDLEFDYDCDERAETEAVSTVGADITDFDTGLDRAVSLVARYSKTDWLDLGLELLTSEGSQAIRIEVLCSRAEKTKGSLYHHFKDRDEYVGALMRYWEQNLTQEVINKTNKISDPVGRLRTLNELASGIDATLERTIRRWAGSEPLVEEGVARVDRRRVDYLARLWQDAKDISSQQAIDLAVMDYAIMVGFQQLYVDVRHERRSRINLYYEQLIQTLPNRE